MPRSIEFKSQTSNWNWNNTKLPGSYFQCTKRLWQNTSWKSSFWEINFVRFLFICCLSEFVSCFKLIFVNSGSFMQSRTWGKAWLVGCLPFALWRPLGRTSVCGAPLTITDSEWGAPLSAPGAYLKLYLQFGADAPLAENPIMGPSSTSLELSFSSWNCVQYIWFQPLRCTYNLHVYEWQN